MSKQLALAALIAASIPMMSQAQTAQAAFEVASVKPSPIGHGGVNGSCRGTDSRYTPGQASTAPPLGRCVIHDARLSHLVSIAFGIRAMDMIKSGPDWIARGDERFNIDAKVEDPSKATEAQLLKMLQALLVERFQMKYHLEPQEIPGLALTLGKGAPKLQATKSTEEGREFTSGGKDVFKPAPGAPTSIKMRKCSMAKLSDLLNMFSGTGNPVVDRTGLTGEYDFTLSWDENEGPTLATAIHEQLGLRLEATKVQQSLFVIDSAMRPAGN